jgi:hypothetical protein
VTGSIEPKTKLLQIAARISAPIRAKATLGRVSSKTQFEAGRLSQIDVSKRDAPSRGTPGSHPRFHLVAISALAGRQ